MKSTKPSYKSFKKIVSKNSLDSNLSSTKDFGLTLIPIGSDTLFVALPNLRDTYTYNIINTAEMTGDITLKTSAGASLKGLMLRSNGGSLSIDPIQIGTDEITLEGDVKMDAIFRHCQMGINGLFGLLQLVERSVLETVELSQRTPQHYHRQFMQTLPTLS